MNFGHCNCTQDTLINHMARFNRISWRMVLGQLAGAASRLHRYREMRARVIGSALDQRAQGNKLLPPINAPTGRGGDASE